MRILLPALLIASTLATALPAAEARPVRYRAIHRAYLHRHFVAPTRIGVLPDALITNRYGDIILDGTTGFHRSTFGVMVPDSEGPSVIATGRASGTGLGANGLPGRNWQDGPTPNAGDAATPLP